MYMHDIRLFPRKPLGQALDVAQGGQPLLADRPIQVSRTTGAGAIADGSVPCNDRYPVTPLRQEFTQLRRDELGTSDIEPHQSLDYVHGSSPPELAPQGHSRGEVINTGRVSGIESVILIAPGGYHQFALRSQIIERRMDAVITAMVSRKKIRMMFFMARLRKCFNRKTAVRRRGGF
jgi:hypothetical protein